MKILIDMNLSPLWREVLQKHGWSSVHWSEIGDPRARDETIFQYAKDHGYVIFTHDLDFGAILACSRGEKPSVVQVRTQDVLPPYLEPILIPILQRYEKDLEEGAIVVVDQVKGRVRRLPLKP